MSQPTPYSPSTSFIPYTNIGYVPGQQLDIEFNDLATTLGEILSNLKMLQRDDLSLANGIVDLPQLAPNVLSAISAGAAAAVASSGYTNNITSVTGAGALAKFYAPFVFGGVGTGVIDRFNRVLVGGATASSGDLLSSPVLPTTPSWLDTLFQQALIGEAQFGVLHTWGVSAIVGASKSSGYRANIGSGSGGTAGAVVVGVNDDLISATPIALGENMIGVRIAGCTGLTLGFQADLNNAGSVTTLTPHGGITAGATIAGHFTSGAYALLGTTNVSAAITVAQARLGGPIFNKGMIFFEGALDTGVGHAGVAVELARGYSFRWFNASGIADSEVWADSLGLTLNSGVNIGPVAAPLVSANLSFLTMNNTAGSGLSLQVNGTETGRVLVTAGAMSISAQGGGALSLSTTAGTVGAVYCWPSGGVFIGNASNTDPGVNNATVSGSLTATTYKVSSSQVVGARVTGWNSPTTGGGAISRGTYDTGATLLTTAETLAALITDLRAHGLIGT